MLTLTKSKNLWLADRIIEAYKENSFRSAVIFGRQGVGKTTYALKCARDVYATLKGISKDDAWDYAFNNFFMDLSSAVKRLKEAFEHRETIPVVIFDDAGVWLSKYAWYERYMKALYNIFALIRNLASAVIFTAPSPNDIAFFLREKGWYQIKIVWFNKKKKEALAQLYTKTFAKGESGFIEKVKYKAIDHYVVWVPDVIYQMHMQKRREVERRMFAEIESALSEIQQKVAQNEVR